MGNRTHIGCGSVTSLVLSRAARIAGKRGDKRRRSRREAHRPVTPTDASTLHESLELVLLILRHPLPGAADLASIWTATALVIQARNAWKRPPGGDSDGDQREP